MADKFAAYTLFIVVLIATILRGEALGDDFVITNFGARGDGTTDDTDAFVRAWNAACSSTKPANLIIPLGKFLVRQHSFKGCQSTNITIQVLGSIVAPFYNKQDKVTWPDVSGDWLSFSDITNLSINGNGIIDGNANFNTNVSLGWWCNEGSTCDDQNRPTALAFHHCDGLTVTGLQSRNPPKNHLSINKCNGATVSGINFQAPQDSPNTDGIDISNSSNVFIHDSFIGSGDDCIAINAGSSNINVTRLICGPGHGVSVGSLGKNPTKFDTVEEVHVYNCTFNGTQNGARIKTFQGGRGYARQITFEDIIVINAGNPIVINQAYCPHNKCPNPTQGNAVEVSFISYKGIHGTFFSDEAIDLNCSSKIPCHNILFDGINIMPSPSRTSTKNQSVCTHADNVTFSHTVLPVTRCSDTKSKEEDFISMVVDQASTDDIGKQDHTDEL